ncbi:hypothetical protein NEOKW01_0417 [Nematocida sp. AWRm80]|nr:hypothetical protein NEOKW01_0417 [Nematocida sp. AWRm80]
MNNPQAYSEKDITQLLECFEKKDYTGTIEHAWHMLYSVIIPFKALDIATTISSYIIIVRQLLNIPSTRLDSIHILSIVDLIVQPRKITILEETGEKDADIKRDNLDQTTASKKDMQEEPKPQSKSNISIVE